MQLAFEVISVAVEVVVFKKIFSPFIFLLRCEHSTLARGHADRRVLGLRADCHAHLLHHLQEKVRTFSVKLDSLP